MSNPVTVSLRASSNRPAQSMSSEERDQVDWSKLTNVPSITAGSGLTGGGPLTADVTLALQAGTIQNSSLASMATKTIKGNSTASTAAPTDLSVSTFSAMVEAINTDVDAGTATNSLITPRKLKRGYTNSPYYVATGTGAQTRAPREKARDIIHVYDYLTSTELADVIAGTATNDHTSSVQNAINAAAGAKLDWGTGTYSVTTLSGVSNTVWLGSGAGGTLIKKRGSSDTDLIAFNTKSNFRIDGLTFSNEEVSNSNGKSVLAFASCSQFVVQHCYVQKFTKIGVALNNCTYAWVRANNVIKTTASTVASNNAISLDDSAGRGSYIWVTDNICTNAGIIVHCDHAHFSGNRISGWKYGAGIAIGYSVAYGASLYNNVIGNTCASGTGIDGDGFDLKGIECYGYYTRIIGNQLFGNSGPGIVASNSYTTIIGNTCYNNCTYGNADTAGINLNYSTVTVGTATGTGSNGVNTITVTGVSGTIAVGYAVTGTNIAANALVRSYNAGTGVVTLEFSGGADANNTGAVSGTISFSTHWGAHTSTVIGNICFDTAGAGGTQNYGIELDYRLLQLSIYANQCESNKLGAYRVNNGGSSATTLSCSFVGQSYLYSFTWNASSISNGASLQQAETVSGAELGDLLTTSCSIALNGLTLTAEVHATNTIYITLTNNSGGAVDLASATFRVRGEKPLF